MKKEDFLKALELISGNHTTEMILNKPIDNHVGDLGTTDFTITITQCCASVINKLKDNNYQLSMHNGGLNIDKY